MLYFFFIYYLFIYYNYAEGPVGFPNKFTYNGNLFGSSVGRIISLV